MSEIQAAFEEQFNGPAKKNADGSYQVYETQVAWSYFSKGWDAAQLAAKEQEEIRLAAISTAALGYWTEKDSIKPEYDHPALRDVAKLYAKYEAQLAVPAAQGYRLTESVVNRLDDLGRSWMSEDGRDELDDLINDITNGRQFAHTVPAAQLAAPASDLRAFGMKVGHEIAGWIDANDPLPDVEAIVEQILAAEPQGEGK